MTLLHAVRQLQVPLVAVVLLSAFTAKSCRALRARSVRVVSDATGLFPPRLRRPATMALCLLELTLGAGLLVTAGRTAHQWADGFRLAAGLFFLIATAAVAELREHRPALGCGCFGELSGRPPGVRSALRPAVLAAAALASVHAGDLAPPPPGPAAAGWLGLLVMEFLLVAALSPEVGEVLARLGYSEPCELRPAPPQRALASLHRSRAWRRHSPLITRDEPADAWRELCWWYLVYPARDGTADRDVVFAVEVQHRRPAVRAAVVSRDRERPFSGFISDSRAERRELDIRRESPRDRAPKPGPAGRSGPPIPSRAAPSGPGGPMPAGPAGISRSEGR